MALYALHNGEYVPYILGAPDFMNREFKELFADGLPATPIVGLHFSSCPLVGVAWPPIMKWLIIRLGGRGARGAYSRRPDWFLTSGSRSEKFAIQSYQARWTVVS